MKKISMMMPGNAICMLAASVCLFLVASVTSAAITYVDATEGTAGNTTLLDGSQFNSTTANADDGLWRGRSPLGIGGTIFEADAFDANEDAHMLLTTISGLTAGAKYEVFGYFWRDPSNWRLKASIDSNDLNDNGSPANPLDDFLPDDPSVYFSAGGPNPPSTIVGLAVAGDFDAPPILAEGNRNLLQANLGSIVANGSGEILVYIDDGDNLGSNGRRTWYDGVGFQQIPEPTSLVLFGLGVAMMLGRRQKGRS